MALIKLGANAITALPAGVGGKVLQIVQGIKTDTMTSTTMNTFLASGLSASITPSATSSKILVLGTISIAHNQDTNSVAFRLNRGGTAICVGDGHQNRARVSSAAQTSNKDIAVSSVMNFLDTPSTTSATTYSVDIFGGAGGSGWIGFNVSYNDGNEVYTQRSASTITLMEIAG